MITDAPSRLPVSVSHADKKGEPNETLALEGKSKGFSLTSHSLSLTTRLFSVDFTWRRLEVDSASPTPGAVNASLVNTSPLKRGPLSPPTPSFAEVLKRQQLASLLTEESTPPADFDTIQASTGQKAAFAGPASRAYKQASSEGPLSGNRLYKA
jgi:hypothetical protein